MLELTRLLELPLNMSFTVRTRAWNFCSSWLVHSVGLLWEFRADSLSLQLGVNDLLLSAAEKSHCSSCTVGQLGLLHGMEPACFTLADTEHLWD